MLRVGLCAHTLPVTTSLPSRARTPAASAVLGIRQVVPTSATTTDLSSATKRPTRSAVLVIRL